MPCIGTRILIVLVLMEPLRQALTAKLRDQILSFPVEIRSALWYLYVEGKDGVPPDGFEDARKRLRAFAITEIRERRNGSAVKGDGLVTPGAPDCYSGVSKSSLCPIRACG